MNQTIKLSLDPRIAKIVKTAQYARDRIDSLGQKKYKKHDLIPDQFLGDTAITSRLSGIIKFFELNKPRGQRGSFIARVRALQIAFWKISSMWYPNGKQVNLSKADFVELLRAFRFPPEWYDGLREALAASGYLQTRTNPGGFELILPAKLPTKLLHPDGIASEIPKINREEELYTKESHLVQHLQQKPKSKVHLNEFVGWTVTSDRPGSKKRQATPDSPEFGDWKNPDVIGYRPRESLNSKVIETLALEVKREFSRAAIAQAESYKEFGNYVALAVYQPYEELLRHSILIQEAVSKGIGVLGIEMLGGNLTWRPIVAPKFLDLRETVIHAVMEEYFPESIVGYNQNQQAGTPHN